MNINSKMGQRGALILGLLFAAFLGYLIAQWINTPAAKWEVIVGRVVGVTDGDTITILDNKKVAYKIRLYGIDTPEKKQDFCVQSKKALSDMVLGKSVVVSWNGKMSWGRYVGKVHLNRLYVNLAMVEKGFAWHVPKYAPMDTDLARAQECAQRAKLGLWSHPDPIPPWEFREANKK